MVGVRQWFALALMVAAALALLVAIGMYAINPFGVQSYDPRQRILGYGIYHIPSGAMLPTLKPGAIVFTSAGYYRNHEPLRGDVVVFAPPHRPHEEWVKRLIGMPGDHVSYRDNVVSINGKPLSYRRIGAYGVLDGPDAFPSTQLTEGFDAISYSILEYEALPEDHGEGDWIVPPGHYFLMGDNRDRSDDSRFWGTVPRSALNGKVVSGL